MGFIKARPLVFYFSNENGTLWMTQKMLAALFDVEVNTITYLSFRRIVPLR